MARKQNKKEKIELENTLSSGCELESTLRRKEMRL